MMMFMLCCARDGAKAITFSNKKQPLSLNAYNHDVDSLSLENRSEDYVTS